MVQHAEAEPLPADELVAIVDAWNRRAEDYRHNPSGGSPEWGHPAMPEAGRQTPDAGFRCIEIQGINVCNAHYEFIVRARDPANRGAGGVVGIELHVEPHSESHLRVFERLRSELIRKFPRISAEHWVYGGGRGSGDRLSFLVPANVNPDDAVTWMRNLIHATRETVLVALSPAR